VSSPGIDRPLTRAGDFAKWAGHEVRVEIGTPVDGRKRFHGFIVGEHDGAAQLRLKDGGEATIPLGDMVKAHLVLTDTLIRAAQAKGQAKDLAEDIEEDFDEIEVEPEDMDADETAAPEKRK
jgi:ribosome maturation factor RimP